MNKTGPWAECRTPEAVLLIYPSSFILCFVGGAMSQAPAYTEYHPRWYRRRVSTYWWMGRWSYLVFILRELSRI